MKIALGCDHAGLQAIARIRQLLQEAGHEVTDCGTHGEASVDYPDFAERVGRAVQRGEVDGGVLLCGTGIGMAIAANKLRGIRCAVVHDEFTARMAREHNHANVLALGARLLAVDAARRLVDAWLAATPKSRHQRRLDKIAALENVGAAVEDAPCDAPSATP